MASIPSTLQGTDHAGRQSPAHRAVPLHDGSEDVEMGNVGLEDRVSRSEPVAYRPVADSGVENIIPAPAQPAQAPAVAARDRARNILYRSAALGSRSVWNIFKVAGIAWLSATAGTHLVAPMRSCIDQNRYLDAEPYTKLDQKVYGKGLWLNEFGPARAYLAQSPTSLALFARLYESDGGIFLRDAFNGVKEPGDTYSVGTGRTIVDLWPNSRLESTEGNVVNGEPACTTNSGAIDIQHEFGHAEWEENNPFGQRFLSILNDPAFDDFEEFRVIRQTNIVADELGEQPRQSHHGVVVESKNVTDNNRNRCTGTYPPEAQLSTEPYQATTFKARLMFYLSTLHALPVISPSMLVRASKVFSEHDALVHEIQKRQASGTSIEDLHLQWGIHRYVAVEVASTFKRTQDLTVACPFPTKLHIRG